MNIPRWPRSWASWKLSPAVAIAIAAGLLLAGLSIAAYNEHLAAAQRLREVTVQADILSGSVAGALAFDDRGAAKEYVGALRANRDVQAAGVYDMQGRLVAGYAKPGASLPANVQAGRAASIGDALVVTAPVVQRSERLGAVYLSVIREPLARRAMRFGVIAMLVVMASLVVAVLGASNASLYEAHRKLTVEVGERAKAETALRESQEQEAKARLAVATERARAALRQSEQQLEFALNAGRLGSWELNLETGRLVASEFFRANFGLAPGDTFERYAELLSRIHPDDRPNQELAVDRAIEDGTDLDIEYRTLKPNGETGWTLVRGRALYDPGGAPVRLAGVSLDITARKFAEERQRLLLNELNHRVKNTLATVQSIAMQTSRNTKDPTQFASTFMSRIGALAQAHELLSESSWDGASLSDVVRRTLAPHVTSGDRGRVSYSGPPINLGPNAAVTLNMAFHELATNAAKYGSLSVAGGRVDVVWTIEQGDDPVTILINWRESDGPAVAPPERRGFGSRLIEHGLAREFDGSVHLTFGMKGVCCQMRLPLSKKMRAAA